MGFRRSGEHIYRPWCDACGECKSVRVPVDNFNASKSQKRVLKRNQDLHVSFHMPSSSDEIYALYADYISQRHGDGDMYPPSLDQFESFFVPSTCSEQNAIYMF